LFGGVSIGKNWIPAFAGMTKWVVHLLFSEVTVRYKSADYADFVVGDGVPPPTTSCNIFYCFIISLNVNWC